ncbi:MAG TPA: Ig-like domain-containing protein [Thermoleophilaceae bacterium]
MSTRFARVLALVVALALLVFAAPASAVNFTSSQITTPANGTFPVFNLDAPATLHVDATTSGGDSNADLVCYFGVSRKVLASNVTVTGGVLNADVSTAQMDTFTQGSVRPYCQLRAVPTGDATGHPPDAPSTFQGPRLGFARTQTYTIEGTGPNKDIVNDFLIASGQSQGYMDYFSLGFCGLDYSSVFDPITLEESDSLFYCNGWLAQADGCRPANANCSGATRSGLLVDGMGAYLPGNASRVWEIDATHDSERNPGYPTLTFTKSIDPLNGDVHITESNPVVRCSPNGTAYHASVTEAAWQTDCSSFVSAGVRVDRTALGDQNGRRGTFTDVWTSTDGAAHPVDVIYDQEFHGEGGTVPPLLFDYLWNGDPFVEAPKDQTVAGPPSPGPATVLVDGNGPAADVFEFPQGAVTFSMAPAVVHWYGGNGSSVVYGSFQFVFTVPADGSVVVKHSYVQGSSKDEVATGAALDRDRLGSPQVAITAPANGSTVNNASALATGTATDPGGAVTSLTVNGDAVTPGADGSWSKALNLAQGENTITAVAADAAGNSSTATSKVTFTPAPPVVPPVVPGVADKIAPTLGLTIAKTKLAALLARGLRVKVSCSEACTFVITLLLDRKTAKRVGLAAKSVKVGSAKGSLAAKGSKTVRVKLTNKAKKKLRKVKKVTLTVTATAKDTAGNTSKKSTTVVVKRR